MIKVFFPWIMNSSKILSHFNVCETVSKSVNKEVLKRDFFSKNRNCDLYFGPTMLKHRKYVEDMAILFI